MQPPASEENYAELGRRDTTENKQKTRLYDHDDYYKKKRKKATHEHKTDGVETTIRPESGTF